MIVAVTYENEQVFQHFGHTSEFKIYEIEDDKIKASRVVSTGGKGHGSLAGFLKEAGVDTVICGGIGGGAKAALAEMNIRILPGVVGNADEQVRKFLSGDLSYDPNIQCSHHGADHKCHQ